MLRSRLCDYSDAYILFKGNIAVRNTGSVAASNNKNKITKRMITFEKSLKVKEMISQPVVHWLCLSQSYYKVIAVGLSKQKALDADPKAIQGINFTANLDQAGQTSMHFITEEVKEIVSDFPQETVKVL